MILSERRRAILAIAIGLMGLLPVLPMVANLFGYYELAMVLSPLGWPSDIFFLAFAFLAKEWPNSFIFARLFFHFFIAPTLFLWGILKIQSSERGRSRVIFWASIICLITAPLGFGLILCLPLFLCVLAPIARRFKAERDALRTGQNGPRAP